MIADLWAQFTSNQAGPVVQFIKYSIAGGVATVVDITVFYLISWLFIPALREDDPIVKALHLRVTPLDEERRSTRFVVNTLITFLFSNLTAYLINAAWVFKAGRYVWWLEMLFFYIVSGVSLALAAFVGWMMIKMWKTSTTASYVAKLLAALLINYACRKFLIFNG